MIAPDDYMIPEIPYRSVAATASEPLLFQARSPISIASLFSLRGILIPAEIILLSKMRSVAEILSMDERLQRLG